MTIKDFIKPYNDKLRVLVETCYIVPYNEYEESNKIELKKILRTFVSDYLIDEYNMFYYIEKVDMNVKLFDLIYEYSDDRITGLYLQALTSELDMDFEEYKKSRTQDAIQLLIYSCESSIRGYKDTIKSLQNSIENHENTIEELKCLI